MADIQKLNVNNTTYDISTTWEKVTGKPSSFTPSSHTHDDRYYTESEINTKLSSKSDTGHTHESLIQGDIHNIKSAKYNWGLTSGIWYRVMVSDSTNVADTVGELIVYMHDPGSPLIFKLDFGLCYHNSPFIHCKYYTAWSGSQITKARIVYKNGYGNQKAYLELYSNTNYTHETTFSFTGTGWSFMTPTATTENYVENLNSNLTITIGNDDENKTVFSNNIKAPKFIGSLSGNSSSATKLTTDAGSATNPIYFSGGKPVACTYSLNKTVPSNAVFTDTNTWRPVTNTYTGSDQSTCVSQYGTNALYNALVNGYASSAGNATYATNDIDGSPFKTTYLRKVTVANNTENDFNSFSNMTLTGRGDPTTGASLKNAPWSGSGPAGGYGVLTYLWSSYGTQMAWGYASNRIYIRNKYYTGGASTWSSSWDSIALMSDIPTSLPASDVYSWAKASTKPTYTYSEVGAAAASHTHSYLPLSGGTVSGTITATGFYQSSDERLKTFYDPIKVDLDKLKTLRKNYFKFNDKDNLEIGVSAQEIQNIYPEIVSTDNDGYLSVAYDKLSVIALAAIDELDDNIKELRRENNDLKDQLEAIKNILKEKGIL